MRKALFGWLFLVAIGVASLRPVPTLAVGFFGAGTPLPTTAPSSSPTPSPGPSGPVQHVVVIVQENQTIDRQWGGGSCNGNATPLACRFCPGDLNATPSPIPGNQQTPTPSDTCLNTVGTDSVSGTTLSPLGHEIQIFDPAHNSRGNWTSECNATGTPQVCQMNGFVGHPATCGSSCPTDNAGNAATVFTYIPPFQTLAYRQMIHSDGGTCDMCFQANEAPSEPAHSYIWAGQAGGYNCESAPPGTNPDCLANDHEDLAANPNSGQRDCNATQSTAHINVLQTYPGTTTSGLGPCTAFKTLADLANTMGLSWKWYDSGADPLWAPCGWSLQFVNNTTNCDHNSSDVLTDISNSALPAIAWVTPTFNNSDHPPSQTVTNPDGINGPIWVTSIVNAIGNSAYWNNTVIIVMYDDWGGWFDHVAPTLNNPNAEQEGYRTPMWVMGTYAKAAYIDRTHFKVACAVDRFIEETWNMPSLGTCDSGSYDLSGFFSWTSASRAYVPIPTPTTT